MKTIVAPMKVRRWRTALNSTSYFPTKWMVIKKNRETTKVPYLNMVKIRDMMAKREKKIRKEVEADNKRINPTDKIIKRDGARYHSQVTGQPVPQVPQH